MDFASSNINKYNEINHLVSARKNSFEVTFRMMELKEIQSDSLLEVAENKVLQAFRINKKEIFVEDDGLFIEALKDFPGVYSSYVNKTIGNVGILDLLGNKVNRNASFKSIIAFHDGNKIELFTGEIKGKIGFELTTGGWGFDPIFIPENSDLTFGQMDMKTKNQISHRKVALDRFLKWYQSQG
ncbi:Non-canonical purine NTP pyrophosphatase [Candidatus Nitrosocosmicus oleophilus]|jgi:XTP/dITP diphosphohydrolase|uniref:Non-canonical purine NTP pyrophosphatase n=1 Tax=Candidatus Nitrosocosmicus oleophilus TaxID=1353260 RepID=A0A654LYP6_9ARCH|nr:RdgB/HAM1 family non-canonical purine NTP pyrophosphatase [Candidatus Nitrosocosmicus oleophilus]ALI36107.1 Non-canonical purine NTP pyrophosphatase [Candidatus Nitrosocosmicus oleophilus]